MIYISFGIIAFAMYFIYDINSVKWKNKIFGCLFAVSTCIIGFTTAVLMGRIIIAGDAAFLHNHILIIFAFLAMISFGLMIYSLFFALPFDETYVSNENDRKVCDTGMYALCRHPGILWFCLFYGFAAAALEDRTFTLCAFTYSVLNIIYGLFQDYYSFPKTFVEYDNYRSTVPFLIPTIRSFRNSIDSKMHKQED